MTTGVSTGRLGGRRIRGLQHPTALISANEGPAWRAVVIAAGFMRRGGIDHQGSQSVSLMTARKISSTSRAPIAALTITGPCFLQATPTANPTLAA
jgi:hypothetical protein